MDKNELEKRTKKFALEVIRFVADLPKNKITDVMGYQFLKAGTSIGANYREANRARSKADFNNRISICESEASETQYWLEVIRDLKWIPEKHIKPEYDESSELLALFTSIGKKGKKKQVRSD